MERYVGNERLRQVAEGPHPRLIVDPTEPAVIILSCDPDTKATGIAEGVVFGANIRKVQVAQVILVVKVHQQRTVPNGEIAGHGFPSFRDMTTNAAPRNDAGAHLRTVELVPAPAQ